MIPKNYRIVDISQPVGSQTACFPGDTPFRKKITVSYAEGKVINLTAFTMSPHIGTHADAPIHIYGDMADDVGMAGQMTLDPFVGPCLVVDLAPLVSAITLDQVIGRLASLPEAPRRLLFKTQRQIRYDVFEDEYAYFSEEVVRHVSALGVGLVGIDTPSVDHVRSKGLPAHHALLAAGMSWLENLDLTPVEAGEYFLIALPLKLTELEASPVRAVLLTGGGGDRVP